MDNYKIYYHDYKITQYKVMIPHSIYDEYMQMPYETKDEQSEAKAWIKNKTKGKEWFTDKSQIFDAITTGTINANGKHKVTISKT